MQMYVSQDEHFILHRMIPSDDEQLEKDLTFTTWEPTSKSLEMANSRKTNYLFISSWSTKATHEDLKDFLRLTYSNVLAKNNISIHLHLFDVNSCVVYKLNVQYSPNGPDTMSLSHQRFPLGGRQMLITFFLSGEPDPARQQIELNLVISLLRHQMGLDFVVHETLRNYYDVKNSKASVNYIEEMVPEYTKDWFDPSALKRFNVPSSALAGR